MLKKELDRFFSSFPTGAHAFDSVSRLFVGGDFPPVDPSVAGWQALGGFPLGRFSFLLRVGSSIAARQDQFLLTKLECLPLHS